MKRTLIELDVDIIGGQGVLTDVEEKAISEYLLHQKMLRNKSVKNNKRISGAVKSLSSSLSK